MILIILLFITIIGVIYYKSNQAHSIWKNKGVSQSNPIFLFGDFMKLMFKEVSVADVVQKIYNKFPNKRYIGIYQFYYPILCVTDPDLLKQLTVKNFDHFTDHRSVVPDNLDPLFSQNLFSLKGDQWKNMRSILSPAFTGSKMKGMFSLMIEYSEQFTNYLLKNNGPTTINLKDISTRFGNDVIATCAFGVKCDSLKEKDNEFYRMGNKATDLSSFSNVLRLMMLFFSPKISKLLGIKFFANDVASFFKSLITGVVNEREEKHIIRPDMIHLLIEARKGRLQYDDNHSLSKATEFGEESNIEKVTDNQKVEITDDDMCAQALSFFFAGFDSVSTLISFTGYELAVNPDIQERLRNEIHGVLKISNGEITYEGINKMKYLDMVICESLRKWPPIASMDRECTKSYTIKSETPDESDLHLNVGDVFIMPIWGLHRDPKYFPNPEKFDPERFNDENKHNIKPHTYIPFGGGPRNCIGSRFALLEAKIFYVSLLSKFELYVVDKTLIPMKLKKSMTVTAEGGYWVGLKPKII